ncbi:MAG TPA: Na(+)-translocating NADH-quinone reductase subunit A [Burkholderiaceae bacterium]|nr:Na(+)-translocating NADH-quinone reductase subunit A [Burkholderiaceae bacterium]
MTVVRSKKGLDLPLAGAPSATVEIARAVSTVAVLGPDYPGLKPALKVDVGDRVAPGQALFEDKQHAGVRYTAPAGGTVKAIHRGERRALVSVVIAVDESVPPIAFSSYRGPEAQLDEAAVRALLLESGLWTALRTRPFAKVAAPGAQPAAIFVTATDSRPHAVAPATVIGPRNEDFRAGLAALALLAPRVFVCVAGGHRIDAAGVEVVEFAGPHPSGNAGWHVHRLLPVDLHRSVWTIGYQDVIAIGCLVTRGVLDVERVIALGGPAVRRPRLLRTRLGASLDELLEGELLPGRQRVISGSVLDGRARTSEADAFLGRHHLQIAALPEGGEREMFGYIAPGAEKFSVTNTVLGAFRRAHRFALSTTTNGSPRAMVPIGSYERVMPFDMLPTFLLRALITGDDQRAAELGALELDEDDVALCTYVCPGKTEYGPLLRAALDRIEKEH